MKRSELKLVAKELTELTGCSPAIDATQEFDQVKADIVEVAGLAAKSLLEKLSVEAAALLAVILKKAAKTGAESPVVKTEVKEKEMTKETKKGAKVAKPEVKKAAAKVEAKATKPVAKEAGEKKPRATVAAVIRAGIAAKKDTEVILKEVKKAFPAANTTPACIAYYRSKAKAEAAKG